MYAQKGKLHHISLRFSPKDGESARRLEERCEVKIKEEIWIPTVHQIQIVNKPLHQMFQQRLPVIKHLVDNGISAHVTAQTTSHGPCTITYLDLG